MMPTEPSPPSSPSSWGFLLKVFGLSTLLSIVIKQLGPFLPISATPSLVLEIVFTPSLFLGLLLALRSQRQL
jgi:hypothetical protein